MAGIDILAIILIAVFFVALVFYGYSLGKAALQGAVGWIALAFVSTLGLLFIVYLFLNIDRITPADWAQILLLLGLIGVTGYYALSATKQARDTAKMAEEMRTQRVMASRPVIVQKDVYRRQTTDGIPREFFSHFEIYNAGNSPAIGLEILLLDKEKGLLEKRTEPIFLRAAESTTFSPSSLVSHAGSTCYLLCRYQSVFSCGKGQIWYESWLPFEPIKSQARDYVYVKAGELEFCEVFEKEDY